MIYDHLGRPIKLSELRREQGGPDAAGVRTYAEMQPARALSPSRLANILRSAAAGQITEQAQLFDDMEEKDLHLFGEISKRKKAVSGLPWQVQPWDDSAQQAQIAEACADMLEGLKASSLFFDLADGIGKGFSCVEIFWDNYRPARAKMRPQTWFQWAHGENMLPTDMLRLKDGTMGGQELWPGKWLVHFHPAKSGSPFRGALYRVLAWLYLFRNYSTKAWVEFLEGYGIPLRIGKYPLGTSQDDQDKLLEAVITLANTAGVIIPDGMEIEIKEAVTGRFGTTAHGGLLEWAAKEMSKAILGQTLSADSDGKGSYALGQVHNGVRLDLVADDALKIEETLQEQLIRPFVDLNFGPQEHYPAFVFDIPKPDTRKLDSEILTRLVEAGFTQIPLWWIRERFGVPAPADGDETLADLLKNAQRPPAGRKEPNAYLMALNAKQKGSGAEKQAKKEQAVLDKLADLAIKEGQAHLDQLLEPVLNMIEQAETLEEVRDNLAGLFPGMDDEDFQDLLARAAFAGHIYGRADK